MKVEQRIAAVVDIWSSTKILENLIDSNNLDKWAELFMDLDQLLAAEKQNLNFENYKFTGDGWILLFDPSLPNATELFPVLERLSDRFNDSFRKTISDLLIPTMEYRGLRMGLDIGELVQFEVNGQIEYVGWPINVAARLQDAVKEGSYQPGTVLISERAWPQLKRKPL